jgi:hypothetical protein
MVHIEPIMKENEGREKKHLLVFQYVKKLFILHYNRLITHKPTFFYYK